MAYQFPVGYQPYYPQYSNTLNTFPTQQSVTPTQPTQGSSSLIWVQGEAGAKSYMVAPNNTVALWDSESQTVYLKSADASGMPSMRVLDYQIRDNTPASPIMGAKTDFATKGDISIIQSQIDEIRANLSGRKAVKDESDIQAT